MKSYEREARKIMAVKSRERERKREIIAYIGEGREETEDGEGIYRGLERKRERLLVNLRAVGLLFFSYKDFSLFF